MLRAFPCWLICRFIFLKEFILNILKSFEKKKEDLLKLVRHAHFHTIPRRDEKEKKKKIIFFCVCLKNRGEDKIHQ